MHVSDIRIYPLKSARGTSVDEAVVEPRGLRGDRRWVLVDGNGTFISQRSHPSLALIETGVSAGCLTASAPGMSAIEIREPGAEAAHLLVRIWRDTVDAVVAPEEANEWFSRFVGVDLRLAFMHEAQARPVDATYAVGDDFVSFADGFPLLLTSTSSLADLNRRLDHPVPMDRFRPNLVVEGAPVFDEDAWHRIRVGDLRLHVAKPCARCVVTTVDQTSGERGKEPLQTLATFRNRDGKVYFGQNLIPLDRGTIRRGDPVEILE